MVGAARSEAGHAWCALDPGPHSAWCCDGWPGCDLCQCTGLQWLASVWPMKSSFVERGRIGGLWGFPASGSVAQDCKTCARPQSAIGRCPAAQPVRVRNHVGRVGWMGLRWTGPGGWSISRRRGRCSPPPSTPPERRTFKRVCACVFVCQL